MKIRSLNAVYILLPVLFLFASCKKGLVHKTKSITENTKGTKFLARATIVLIPGPGDVRVATVPDGYNMFGTMFTNRLIDAGFIDGLGAGRVTNPNSIGELPQFLGSNVFTGMAMDMLATDMGGNKIILSRTGTTNHYMYFATQGTHDYVINNYLTVTAPFAPVSAGWKLKRIEYTKNTDKVYGIFGPVAGQSIIAEINRNTGVATALITINDFFFGLDFWSPTPNGPSDLYLLSSNNTNTACEIYKLSLSTLTYTVTTTTVPTNGAGSFLYCSGYNQDECFIYSNSNTFFSAYSLSANIWSTYITQRANVYVDNSSGSSIISEGPPVNLVNQIIIDAAN